jgi:hypothetical protein
MGNCLLFGLDLFNLGFLLRGCRLFFDFSIRVLNNNDIIFDDLFFDVLTVFKVDVFLAEQDFFVFFLLVILLLISHNGPEMILIVIEKYCHLINLLVIKNELLLGLLFLDVLLLLQLLIHVKTIFLIGV